MADRNKPSYGELERRLAHAEAMPRSAVPERRSGDSSISFESPLGRVSEVEEALRESERQKSLILDATSELFACYDTELRVIWANRAAAESVGKAPEELVGRHCYEVWHRHSSPCRDCPVLKARDDKAPHTGEQRTPDGRCWSVRGYPVLDEAGEVTVLIELTMDITERKRAEEALRESRAGLFALIENMDGSVWSVDRAYRLLAGNSVFHREIQAIRGRAFSAGESVLAGEFSEEERAVWRGLYDRALGGEAFLLERERRSRCPSRYMEYRFNPIRAADGTVTGVTVYGRDVTRQKLAEEQLQAYARDLEGRVEERARALRETQEELLEKEKLAAVGELAGGVAHELRNPLGAVKNAAYYLNMVLESPDESVRETLDILDREIAGAEGIVQALLACADSQSPGTAVETDLNAYLKGALGRMTLPEGIEAVLDLDSAPLRCVAAPDLLDRVIQNLLQNGVQAMGDTGRLTLTSRPGEPGRVTFSVEDTGHGMDEELRKEIFRPLFTTRARGIGLGLPLARAYVEACGGSIEVESEKGRGSTFTVTLPGKALSKAGGEEGDQES